MSRNSSGTYSLPVGNPVVTGGVIEASWANSTMTDIGDALTDSLSRSGKGGMTAAFRIIDGSVSTPGFAFANETGSGAYRSAAGDWYLTVLGGNIVRLRSTGVDVTGALGVSGGITGDLTGNASTATSAGKWTTARTLSYTGDATGSGSVDGSANVSFALTLADTAVTPGSYTFSSITVDSKGRVTAASSGAAPSSFPAGTLMLFQQTSAPTGWTKQTTHNDKALRVVSGTAASGGSVAFSTAMATPTVSTAGLSAGATTLSTSQIPSHTHSYTSPSGSGGYPYDPYQGGSGTGATTGATGGGGSHSHSISGSATATINVAYVDLIIASKN